MSPIRPIRPIRLSTFAPPRTCLICHHHLLFARGAPFSQTPRRPQEEPTVPNHYDTLGVPPHASTTEIKKSFYALSKRHHPDRNPGNPSAAKRFVQISEAYHVLSSPEGRAKYDRQYHGLGRHGHSSVPRGSHSSHGARPASGLSKRRAHFRGPPPSFYRSGGWGPHGAKRERAQYASTSGSGSHSGAEESSGSSSSSSHHTAPGGTSTGGHASGGFSPGQQTPGYNPDPSIPYWDKAGHFRTQEKLRGRSEARDAQWRAKIERERHQRGSAYDEAMAGGSMLFNFIVVSSVIAAVLGSARWMVGSREERQRKAAVKRENG